MKVENPYGGPSFPLSNRILRAIWGICFLLFFRYSPRPLHCWRAFVLRLFGATVGTGCHVYPKVNIWAPWNLSLGDYVGIGDGVTIYCMDLVSIGNNVVISQGTHLCAGTHDFNSPNFQLITSPILIGDHVWLCTEGFVGPGVSIAEGTVIGARGVVTKSINVPWQIWAGVPVKKIGVRDKARVLQQEN